MPIGNEGLYSVATINAQLGELASRWHDLAVDTLAFFQNVNVLGAAGLEAAPFGMLTQDALDFVTATGYMNTGAGVWTGAATQSALFDFDTNPVIVRARGLIQPGTA